MSDANIITKTRNAGWNNARIIEIANMIYTKVLRTDMNNMTKAHAKLARV